MYWSIVKKSKAVACSLGPAGKAGPYTLSPIQFPFSHPFSGPQSPSRSAHRVSPSPLPPAPPERPPDRRRWLLCPTATQQSRSPSPTPVSGTPVTDALVRFSSERGGRETGRERNPYLLYDANCPVLPHVMFNFPANSLHCFRYIYHQY